MTWNYRIMRSTHEGTHMYTIREVYYDKNDKIRMWSAKAQGPYGEDLSDFQGDLEYMMKAFKEPVLIEEELEKELERDLENDVRNAE